MMSTWKPVSRTEHANNHYLPRQGYFFAAGQQVVPILLAELSRLIPFYALGFIRQQDVLTPVAITGLGGQNLYVNPDGKWLGSYVPAALRGYPFALADNNQGEKVLCIEDSHLADEQGQPLFDADGNLTKPMQDTLNFLNECEKNRKITRAACQELDQAGVIEKWPLQVNRGEGEDPARIDGLYKISEKALNSLHAETFAGLRKNGALALAYAQLFSMNQVSGLSERAKYHTKLQQRQKCKEAGMEQFFGDDDILSFDNI